MPLVSSSLVGVALCWVLLPPPCSPLQTSTPGASSLAPPCSPSYLLSCLYPHLGSPFHHLSRNHYPPSPSSSSLAFVSAPRSRSGRMGKYMRKAKITGEVAVMEVSHQSSLGVRTRARTLALQRLQRSSSPIPAPSPAGGLDSGSYIQLRSRRLEKPPAVPSRSAGSCKGGHKPGAIEKPVPLAQCPRPRPASCSVNSGSVGSALLGKSCSKKAKEEELSEASHGNDGVEASFGENFPESDGERNVRETTPCSLVRDSEIVGTPGSATRPKPLSGWRTHSVSCRNTPTTDEMEEFFVGAEKLQQRIFTEKYNFDLVNDCPLHGRYEWVPLDS